jgi:REP element-mobilizing transposase RayT
MYTYALTTATYPRRSLFVRTANAKLMVETFFHYRDQVRYLLLGFAIMPEHLHVLLSPSSGQTIEHCAQCIKGGFSHEFERSFPERSGSQASTSTGLAMSRIISISSNILRPIRNGWVSWITLLSIRDFRIGLTRCQ